MNKVLRRGTSITLTSNELLYCWIQGAKRNQVHLDRGSQDTRMNKFRDPIELNAQGLMGEIAFCKMLELDYRQFTDDTTYRNHLTDNGDVEIPGNKNWVDLKTVIRDTTYLFVKKNKSENPCMYYGKMRVLPMIPGKLPIPKQAPVTVFFDGILDHTHCFYTPSYYNIKKNQYEIPTKILRNLKY